MSGFERALATPIVITKDMNEAEFAFEFARMQMRSQATSEFVAGRLEVDEYFECLHEGGVDPFQLCDIWKTGQTLM